MTGDKQVKQDHSASLNSRPAIKGGEIKNKNTSHITKWLISSSNYGVSHWYPTCRVHERSLNIRSVHWKREREYSLCLIILLPTLKVTVFREAVLKHLMSLPACSAVIPISLRSLLWGATNLWRGKESAIDCRHCLSPPSCSHARGEGSPPDYFHLFPCGNAPAKPGPPYCRNDHMLSTSLIHTHRWRINSFFSFETTQQLKKWHLSRLPPSAIERVAFHTHMGDWQARWNPKPIIEEVPWLSRDEPGAVYKLDWLIQRQVKATQNG